MSAMKNPPHPGETVRFECLEAAALTVTEAARQLRCSRPTLSRVLNGRAAISPEMALAFEGLGWSSADFWMRRQAAYNLAQARRRADAA
ncbi:HigA family addiction module antitoxin [Candidatus Rariloculus sp.]|uniref:HigA family addiction module antitoxin n=1 Tax=Candidatus Rariloculus sp. TaxID=3101265 RepID=UPI003D0A0FE5